MYIINIVGDFMKKTVLCILDGVGLKESDYGNALKLANTPNFDYLWDNYPHTVLGAASGDVGLPEGQMGNSEVGHMNMGAGRIIYQDLVRINKSIEDESFYKNSAFLKAINNCKENNSNLHICGMISDGGIHSQIFHLFALLEMCKRENFDRVYIHAILDGRDTEPSVAPKYVKMLKEKIAELSIGTIVTIQGRYYIMNRDRNWNLTEYGYNAIVNGISDHNASTTEEAFEMQYKENVTDEFMKPTVLKSVPIVDNDSMILFNYRSDRMIQVRRALKDPNFKDFKKDRHLNIVLSTICEYEIMDYDKDVYVAFPPELIDNSLGEYISKLGYKQLRLSEAEKRGHVTFYFSGCTDLVYENEDRVIFDKDDVFTYDEKPDMRSKDITKTLIDAINNKDYSLIVVNYPNGDAVGHSGKLDKAIEAMEALDECLGKIISETNFDEYNLIITADHGNCEVMLDEDGGPDKKHTTNLVPFILMNKKYKLKEFGVLGSIAPTILEVMGLDKPSEMTCNSLISEE